MCVEYVNFLSNNKNIKNNNLFLFFCGNFQMRKRDFSSFGKYYVVFIALF